MTHTAKKGGAAGWLTAQAPAVPGEIFNLDFYIWDTDSKYDDSTVIPGNFRWICGETAAKTDFSKAAAGTN